MTDFIKKQGAAFWLSAITVVALLLAAALYLAGAVGGYYDDADALIVVMLVLAILGTATITFVYEKFRPVTAVQMANTVVVALCMGAFVMLISDRVLSIGFLLFSELGSENPNAYSCLYLSLAAMAFMLVACITSVVSGFFRYRRDI